MTLRYGDEMGRAKRWARMNEGKNFWLIKNDLNGKLLGEN